jgi:pimeloyl-ACP methyl ester carboxylesterase
VTYCDTGYPAQPDARLVDAFGITLSALVCEVTQPRAVLLALHGGGTTSTYFDCPGRPPFSLLRTAASLGYTAIALDRPGYGISAKHAEEITDTGHHADLAFAALDALLMGRSQGAGVFLLAHSAGCELALRMAATERGRDLIGLELAGTGRQHQWTAGNILDPAEPDAASRPTRSQGLRALLWGPRHLYAPDVYANTTIAARSPRYELEAGSWVDEFPELAAHIRIPVQFSLGDHETVWRAGPEALADIASLFTASPKVRVNEQADAGHNLSLSLSARSYHLKVLSFVEECAIPQRPDGHG